VCAAKEERLPADREPAAPRSRARADHPGVRCDDVYRAGWLRAASRAPDRRCVSAVRSDRRV